MLLAHHSLWSYGQIRYLCLGIDYSKIACLFYILIVFFYYSYVLDHFIIAIFYLVYAYCSIFLLSYGYAEDSLCLCWHHRCRYLELISKIIFNGLLLLIISFSSYLKHLFLILFQLMDLLVENLTVFCTRI